MAAEERPSSDAGARTFVSRSPAATEALGASLGGALVPGAIVALDGDLGSGKTTFVRGLARGLDIADAVSSPTYALLQTYAGRLELYHFDAWMEGRERAFLLDGGLEWLHSGGVAVVEWAQRVEELLSEPRLHVAFEHRGPSERRVRVSIDGRETSERPLARWIASIEPSAFQGDLDEIG